MKIKLEFSEEQQCFHNHYPESNIKAGTNGYKVLGEIDENQSAQFISHVHEKHKPYNSLPLELVRKEFNNYFSEQ